MERTFLNYASPKARIFAKMIDLLFVLLLGLAFRGGPGSILGFLYSLTADGLPFSSFQGQSLGKKWVGVRVYSGTSSTAQLKTSVVRNIPVGLITFLMIIPFWGWILSLLVGIPLGLIEISLLFRAEKRQRLGDVMAESVVLSLDSK